MKKILYGKDAYHLTVANGFGMHAPVGVVWVIHTKRHVSYALVCISHFK